MVEGPYVELTVDNGPRAAAEALRTPRRRRAHRVAGLALREPSLDDVFLKLTGHRAEGEEEPSARRARAGGDPMTAITVGPGTLAPSAGIPPGPAGGRLRWAVADAATVTWRNLINYLRIPDAIFFSSVQPIMFVLLFRFVFGGVIHVPGTTYVNYLMGGIYVETVMFGAVSTSVGLSEDLHKGLIERFRALPMARARPSSPGAPSPTSSATSGW